MLSASFDEALGIVVTVADGLASVEEFDAYLANFGPLVKKSRARHGRCLHLVDAENNPIQTRDVFEHMAQTSRRLNAMRDGDRSAIILQSALAKMQIDRYGHARQKQFFTDRQSAINWLLEEVVP
jgi:hypothetical protein